MRQTVFAFFLAVLASADGLANGSSELAQWTQKVLKEKSAEIDQLLARKVTIIHRLEADKKPSFAKLPFALPGQPAKDGYFVAPSHLDFDAAFGLNYPYEKKLKMPVETWLTLVRQYLDPGMLIVSDQKTKKWSIVKGKVPDDDDLSGRAPTKSRKVSFAKLRRFLNKVYGFEGIVIDRRDNKLLALVLPATLHKSSQAMLIKDSEAKLTISKKDKRVDGILQLRDFDAGLSTASFDMLFRKTSTPIPFGTKLFIQKK